MDRHSTGASLRPCEWHPSTMTLKMPKVESPLLNVRHDVGLVSLKSPFRISRDVRPLTPLPPPALLTRNFSSVVEPPQTSQTWKQRIHFYFLRRQVSWEYYRKTLWPFPESSGRQVGWMTPVFMGKRTFQKSQWALGTEGPSLYWGLDQWESLCRKHWDIPRWPKGRFGRWVRQNDCLKC